MQIIETKKKIPFFSQKINPPPQPTLKYLKHGEFFPDDVKKKKKNGKCCC